MKKHLIITSLIVAGIALLGSVFAFNQPIAAAADHTVNPGQSIQAAIDGAANGDTVMIAAGTYTETLIVTKPITLEGVGTVIIKTTSPTVNKGIDIQNTQNVTLSNLTFDGENGNPMKQTGVDINSVDGITLNNITVRNYAKNGFAVTTQRDSSFVVGGNVAFNNVSVDNAAWAGIAFYTRSDVGNIDTALQGVSFTGTTTVSDTAYGIQFGDSTNEQPIEGVAGAAVDLGEVAFANNDANISRDNADVAQIVIASTSTIDGAAITDASFPGVAVTVVTVPGVPNTGIL